ncbi:MAG: DUF3592 domain-containing protein [Pseudomonadales bacterium]|nr:DUF3592 domain-containing protein [Pseudomonadales bacterium]
MNEEVKLTILLLGYGAVGSAFLWAFFINVKFIQVSLSAKFWPTTQAKIIDSGVTTNCSAGELVYLADISYAYTVEGKKYTSSGVDIVDTIQTERLANHLTGKFKAGNIYQLHVNPRDHYESTLVAGFGRNNIKQCAVVVFTGVAGVCSMLGLMCTATEWLIQIFHIASVWQPYEYFICQCSFGLF